MLERQGRWISGETVDGQGEMQDRQTFPAASAANVATGGGRVKGLHDCGVASAYVLLMLSLGEDLHGCSCCMTLGALRTVISAV